MEDGLAATPAKQCQQEDGATDMPEGQARTKQVADIKAIVKSATLNIHCRRKAPQRGLTMTACCQDRDAGAGGWALKVGATAVL